MPAVGFFFAEVGFGVQYETQFTLFPLALQLVNEGPSLDEPCAPRNSNLGMRPSDGPHENVMLYQVTGPGMMSAAVPPALLWLLTTWYVPPLSLHVSLANTRHFCESMLHFTFFMARPSGDRSSVTVGDAQPAKKAAVNSRMNFIGASEKIGVIIAAQLGIRAR